MSDTVYILMQMDEDEDWCNESVHRTEAGAEKRKAQLAKENDYTSEDTERYLCVEEFKLQD